MRPDILRDARRAPGLAVSVLSAERWDSATLEVNGAAMGAIPHAAKRDHLCTHYAFINATANVPARLRLALELIGRNHISPTSYSGAKHARGNTDQHRRRAAQGPAGPGQFLCRLHNDDVRQLETDALKAACDGRSKVWIHGKGFHIAHNAGGVVGFLGGSGEETTWVRVEWSAGSVHSHPRKD